MLLRPKLVMQYEHVAIVRFKYSYVRAKMNIMKISISFYLFNRRALEDGDQKHGYQIPAN